MLSEEVSLTPVSGSVVGEPEKQAPTLGQLKERLQHIQTQLNTSPKKSRDHIAGLENLSQSLLEQSSLFINAFSGVTAAEEDQLANIIASLPDHLSQLNILGSSAQAPEKIAQPMAAVVSEMLTALNQLQSWRTGQQPLSSGNGIPTVDSEEVTAAKTERNFLAPSSLKNQELKTLLEQLNSAGSTAEKEGVLESIHDFVAAKKMQLDLLKPLLDAAESKALMLERPPLASVVEHQKQLARLDMDARTLETRALNSAFLESLERADQAINALQQFDQHPAGEVFNLMMRGLPDKPAIEHHLLNMLSRKLLSFSSVRLSDKPLDQLVLLHNYHSKRVGQESALDTYQAYQAIAGDVFSSPKSVRALSRQVETAEELSALGGALKDWDTGKQVLLDSTCSDLEVVKKDFDLPEVRTGRDSLKLLKNGFAEFVDREGGITKQERFEALQKGVKESINTFVAGRVENPSVVEKLMTQSAFCKKLASELNEQLKGVATIVVNPTEDGVEYRINMNMEKAEQASTLLLDFVNSRGKLASSVVQRIKDMKPGDLLAHDPATSTYHWKPHPQEMLDQMTESFLERFDEYSQAVALVEKHQHKISQLKKTRMQVKAEAEKLTDAVSPMRKAHPFLAEVDQLGSLALANMPAKVSQTRKQVMISLESGAMTLAEVKQMLPALLAVAEQAEPAKNRVLKASESFDPAEKVQTLQRAFSKKLRPKFIYRLFGSKRLKALEHVDKLLVVCVSAQKAPEQVLLLLQDASKGMEAKGTKFSPLKDVLDGYRQQLEGSLELPRPPAAAAA